MPLKPEQVKSVANAKKIVEERGLTHIKVGVFDGDAILRGKYMSKAKFFSALENGFGLTPQVTRDSQRRDRRLLHGGIVSQARYIGEGVAASGSLRVHRDLGRRDLGQLVRDAPVGVAHDQEPVGDQRVLPVPPRRPRAQR